MSPLSGYESTADDVNTSGKYVTSFVELRSQLNRVNRRAPAQDIPVGESLFLLEAEEADGSDDIDSFFSDDEDAGSPLPALRIVGRCGDDEQNNVLVSEGK